MWEVIFLWMKKRGRSLPLWLLGLIALLFILTELQSFFTPTHPLDIQHEKKEDYSPSEAKMESNQDAHPRNKKDQIEKLKEPHHSDEDRPNEDGNLGKFALGLEKRLQEDHQDAGLSRRLSERIYEGLHQERMGVEDLRRAISEELGPQVSEEAIDRIHQRVVQTLSEISESPGPKPSPESG